MTEDEQKQEAPEGEEKAPEDVVEEPAAEEPAAANPIEEAKKVLEEIKKEKEEARKYIERAEKLKADEMLSGETTAGSETVKETEEDKIKREANEILKDTGLAID